MLFRSKTENSSEKKFENFIVPGGEDEKIKNEKINDKKNKYDDDDDDDDDDYSDDEDGMYDNDDEEINDKFNLKSFTRQPTVILSPGVSVNIVTYDGSEESTENKNDISNLFDAEKYGRMMIQERKDAINSELRKLELEILELDKE